MLADIPGLIEGASSGTGLGDRFLAHIERTVVLVFVVDGSLGAAEALAAVETVRGELGAFSAELAAHRGLIAVNKVDLLDEATAAEVAAALAPAAREMAGSVVTVSAAQGSGLGDLLRELDGVIESAAALAAQEAAAAPEVVVLPARQERLGDYTVERDNESWRLRGRVLERLVAKADLGNDEAMRYLQDVMERAHVSDAVRKAGGVDGDTVVIGDAEFELA